MQQPGVRGIGHRGQIPGEPSLEEEELPVDGGQDPARHEYVAQVCAVRQLGNCWNASWVRASRPVARSCSRVRGWGLASHLSPLPGRCMFPSWSNSGDGPTGTFRNRDGVLGW